MADFDYAVIGNGLIGSAAGRYLSQTGRKVALIGPSEPEDWASHPGVFASHYDQGRITRVLDDDIVWALLAQRSIQQYRAIEEASGVRFYYPVGGMQVGPVSAAPDGHLAQLATVASELGVKTLTYSGDTLKHGCPWLNFPEGMGGILEPDPAGYINPRSLIAAQLRLAERWDAAVLRERVIDLHPKGTAVEIKLAAGRSYRAKRVLVAAGAYTNQLLERPLALTLKARTILLAEVAEAEVERLKGLPTLIYRFQDNPKVDSIYMLPPIRYPDGRSYLKIGGSNNPLIILNSLAELQEWFRSGGSQKEAEALKAVLLSLLPHLKAISFHYKPCVTSYTPHNHPFIDRVAEGLFVAAGGCGAAAKSSNEIGHVAARLVEHGHWAYDLSAETFRAV